MISGLVVSVLGGMTLGGFGATATAEEMAARDRWLSSHVQGTAASIPFSFTYGGHVSRGLVDTWESASLEGTPSGTERVWRDRSTGVEILMNSVAAPDCPVVEWSLTFANRGEEDSPMLESIHALDTVFSAADGSDIVLHHFTGSPCTATDYQPFETSLTGGDLVRLATAGGRGTNTVLPNFNISWNGGGVIATIAWPGQWAAEFEAEDGKAQVRGGQETTHFVLHPGESVRSPRIVLLFYEGDWIRGQNLWRQWMLAHNTPRPAGKLPQPHMAACSSHWYHEMIQADEASQMMFIDRYLDEKLPLDYWWIDAGWYENLGDWPSTGTWEVDTERFPQGLRAITDYGRVRGVKSIVWHEPERVHPGTWLYENHPEWLLGQDGAQKLLNLADANAGQWAIAHFTHHIREQGIDLYRQDFNIDPLPFWQANDAPDRQGLTEIRYIEGYLAYWDALREAFPAMLIDSCASGGRRNDLETLRRAVPLLRSDFILDAVAQQNHTYGIAFWLPLYGTGQRAFDAYGFRSQMTPFLNACYDMRERDADYESLRRLVGQWQDVNTFYYGDYYPLTPYSADATAWMGWQFNRVDLDAGMIQMFRREGCEEASYRVKLHGLERERSYAVADADSGETFAAQGSLLMEQGFPVTVTERPAAVLLTYAPDQ